MRCTCWMLLLMGGSIGEDCLAHVGRCTKLTRLELQVRAVCQHLNAVPMQCTCWLLSVFIGSVGEDCLAHVGRCTKLTRLELQVRAVLQMQCPAVYMLDAIFGQWIHRGGLPGSRWPLHTADTPGAAGKSGVRVSNCNEMQCRAVYMLNAIFGS
jgi:hypothetical protein